MTDWDWGLIALMGAIVATVVVYIGARALAGLRLSDGGTR